MNVLIQGWSNEDESMILFDGSQEDFNYWFKGVLGEPTPSGVPISQKVLARAYRIKMSLIDITKLTPRTLTQAASMEAVLNVKFDTIYLSTYNGEVRSDPLE